MKKTDIIKLKDKTIEELQKDLSVSREELRALKFDVIAGKAKNISTLVDTRKKIARIMTFIAEKSRSNKNG